MPIAIANHSFEDTTGLPPSDEFFFGVNPGWTSYDPSGIAGNNAGSNDIFTGTLDLAPGSPWFNGDTAPDGDLVAIMFGFGNSGSAGAGEYGLEQTLTGTALAAHTTYTLEVEVGNIAEGSTNGTFFALGGFPGYRIEILAGGVVIADDNDLLSIAEGEFMTSVVSFTTGGVDAQLGQELAIRLVNLNQIPAGNNPAAPFDLEVDFDNVRLDATMVSEPMTLAMMGLGVVLVAGMRRRA